MFRLLPCIVALFAFESFARADELDKESAPKQSPTALAATVTSGNQAVGTEMDKETPAAAYHWHGGWGGYHHGGWGGFGGGWGYRPFYSGFYGGFRGFGGFGGFGGRFGGFGYRPFYSSFYRPYFGGFYNYGFSPFGLYNSWYW